MTKKWPGQNTVPPEDLVLHYQKDRTWEQTRFFYENWRLTTGMIDPPKPWDDLDVRIQVAICGVANVVRQDAIDGCND